MLSIVIPAFNEEKRIGSSLEKLIAFLKNYRQDSEVIIVDDGSKDKTVSVAKKYRQSLPNLQIVSLGKNLGKGFAVKTGFEKAKGDIVLFTDADFSTPINESVKLFEKLDRGYDIAIGSRAVDRSLIRKHQNIVRENIGRLANLLIQLLAIPGIKDTQCGFKAFKKTTTAPIFSGQKIFRYAFDVELLYLAKIKGLRIVEVPVVWSNSPDSKVNPLIDAPKSLADLVKIRVIHARNTGSFFEKLLYFMHKKRTFAKFAVVGLSGALVDYSLFFLLTRFLHLSALEANPLNVEVAIIWTFTFNNLWTFSDRNRQRSLYKKFLAFQLVSFGGLLVSQTQILLYTHYLAVFDLLAKLFSIPIVAFFNYFVNNRWTFHHEKLGKKISLYYLLLIFCLFVVYLILVKEITGSFILFINS